MSTRSTDVRARASKAARDETLQAAVLKACEHSLQARAAALSRLPDPDKARLAATEVRSRCVEDMEALVGQLVERLRSRGVVVHQAETAEAARRHAIAVVERARRSAGSPVPLVVKAKSMVGEEMGLTRALEEAGCRVVETDLGEFIVQLRGEPPSHILAPALHLSRSQIGSLFAQRLGMEATDDPARMAAFARRHLRSEFLRADMGIVGVNVAVAATGDLVTVSNEGNARLCATLPPILLVVTGIEKVVATPEDAAAILRVLPRNATGQTATSYVSLLRAPAGAGERWGPREVHVILLDNGRSRIAMDPDLRDILRCIRCGACLNVCPVYRTIGGHAYGTTYPGPMGIVWTAGLQGLGRLGDLAYASTLCGECSRVCPVGIDLAHAILKVRARVRKPWARRLAFFISRFLMAGPLRFTAVGRAAAWMARRWPRLYRRIAVWMGWTATGDVPVPARQSFRRRWREATRELRGPTSAPRLVVSGVAKEGASARVASVKNDGDPNPSAFSEFLLRFAEARGETVHVGDTRQMLAEVVALVRPRLALVSEDAREALEVLRSLGVRAVRESEVSREEAAEADLGVTGCVALVAETGSIVVEQPPGRAASLLPDAHVVLAAPNQVVRSLEEALALTQYRGAPAFTLITGPSRTADIEKTLVMGMHGPRRLILCLLDARGPLSGTPARLD